MERIYSTYPITIIERFNRAIVREAAHLKAKDKMSLVDAISCATAYCKSATLVTADRNELEPVAEQGDIPFRRIRPKPDHRPKPEKS